MWVKPELHFPITFNDLIPCSGEASPGSSCKHILIVNSGLTPRSHLSSGSWTLWAYFCIRASSSLGSGGRFEYQWCWAEACVYGGCLESGDMGNDLLFHDLSKTIVIVSSWEGYKQIWNQVLLKIHVKCEKQWSMKRIGRTGYFSTVSNPGTCVPQVEGFEKFSWFWGAFKEWDFSLYNTIWRACPLAFFWRIIKKNLGNFSTRFRSMFSYSACFRLWLFWLLQVLWMDSNTGCEKTRKSTGKIWC